MTYAETTTTKGPSGMTHIESTRFGTVEVAPGSMLEFPAGLLGLGGTRYVIVAHDETSAFAWLHSAEDPALAIPVTRPWAFFPQYEIRLSDAETARLPFAPDAEPEVWVTVRATDRLDDFSANLKAPILACEGCAVQVINEVSDAPVRAPLFPPPAQPVAY